MKYRPSLQALLLVVNLSIVALPLFGILTLRVYDSELIRRTESELIAQGALVAGMFRQEMLDNIASSGADLNTCGRDLAYPWPPAMEGKYTPIPPQLDVFDDPVFPRAAQAKLPSQRADVFAISSGKSILPAIAWAKRITLSGIRVVDHLGVVVASSGSENGLTIAHRPEVKAALKGKAISILRERVSDEPRPSLGSIRRGSSVRVFVALPVVEQGRVLGAVVLSRTPLDALKALYQRRKIMIISLAVLLGMVLAMSLLATLAIRKPLKKLISQAKRIRQGDHSAAVALEHPVTREVAELSEAFALTSQTLASRADYITTFAGNMSHEFKTPLAAITGTAELLRDHYQTMSEEDRQRFLSIIEDEAKRLDRQVSRLRDLARADVFTPGDDSSNAQTVLGAVARRYQKRQADVSLHMEHGDADLAMAAETLDSVVSNLVENALQHNPEGTAVKITAAPCTESRQKHLYEISVQDNGGGVPENLRDMIFRPFFTTAQKRGGSGLGLAIVRALVQAHHGSIDLCQTETGACFVLRIPLTHQGQRKN